MNNITIVNHSKAKNEISKFKGDFAKITSFGQQLAFWGKNVKQGIITNTSAKRKVHTVEMLEDNEVNLFEANDFQYQYFIIEGTDKTLFVKNDEQDLTQEEIESIIAKNK